jgi:hypothetical protein
MDTKPSDFFVGFIDFFAVILPGALLCAVLAPVAKDHLFGPIISRPTGEAEGWIVFAFAAYLTGHLVFLLASFLDPVYDRAREWLLPRENDGLYNLATELKNAKLGAKSAEVINTFRWARAYIQLRHPKAIAEISKLEADSKFFRSFVVVLVLAVPILATHGPGIELVAAAALVPLAALCCWRYGERRWKSTKLAYEYLITATKAVDCPAEPAASPSERLQSPPKAP